MIYLALFLLVNFTLLTVNISFKDQLLELTAESEIRVQFLQTGWATCASLCAACVVTVCKTWIKQAKSETLDVNPSAAEASSFTVKGVWERLCSSEETISDNF